MKRRFDAHMEDGTKMRVTAFDADEAVRKAKSITKALTGREPVIFAIVKCSEQEIEEEP